jgi:threonine/homoserine/homoserine lactone efflux protein
VSELGLLLQGILLGLAVAAPVGPIGVLCIRRSLADGMAMGFATGLGAAAADGFYGLLAGTGVGLAAALIAELQGPLKWVAVGFLLWLAWRSWQAPPPAAEAAPVRAGGPWTGGLVAAFGSTFLLTLANPITILTFAAIFAGLSIPPGVRLPPGLVLAAGCFVGSALWWLGLSGAVSLVRGRLGPTALGRINRLAALVLAGFALAVAAG